MIVIADLSITYPIMKALKSGNNLRQIVEQAIRDVITDNSNEPIDSSELTVEIMVKERGRCDKVVHDLLIRIDAWNVRLQKESDAQTIGDKIEKRLLAISVHSGTAPYVELRNPKVLFRYA